MVKYQGTWPIYHHFCLSKMTSDKPDFTVLYEEGITQDVMSAWEEVLLRPEMNCTVRFGKHFSESSPCLPGQQGTGQQGWYASGTLR